MKRRLFPLISGISVMALLVAGCGTATPSTTPTNTPTHHPPIPNPNPPFVNRLNVEVAPLDPNFDPTAAPAKASSVQVVTSDGKSVTLSPAKEPIVFVAYWCPHCQRTLVMWNKNWSKFKVKPIIVATGYAPGTTLTQAKTFVAQEEQSLGLTNATPQYYLLDVQEGLKVVKMFPELVFDQNKSTMMLAGEHTLSAWEHVLD